MDRVVTVIEARPKPKFLNDGTAILPTQKRRFYYRKGASHCQAERDPEAEYERIIEGTVTGTYDCLSACALYKH